MSAVRKQRYKDTDELVSRFREWSVPIRGRLAEFASVPAGEYFYELVYCLLTPQSSAVNAAKVVDALKEVAQSSNGRQPVDILADRLHYIRFHNTKARRILEARGNFPEVLAKLTSGIPSRDLRVWIVGNVKGLGWKEASHFLRNIGHRDLAILDRHILRNLRRHGVIRSLPKTLTRQQYLRIEERFRRFAGHVGISMDELDLLFWSRETGKILK